MVNRHISTRDIDPLLFSCVGGFGQELA